MNYQEEHERAKLNLIAGKKAKASTDYEPALKYLTIAMGSLSENCWQCLHGLTFKIYMERAECEYLNGNFDEAEKLFDTILLNSGSALEKAKVYNLKIVLYTNLGKNHEAVELGREGLKLFGVNLQSKPGKMSIMLGLMKVFINLRNRRIENLENLPEITDLHNLAVMSLLGNMFPPTYFIDRDLFSVAVLKVVQMSLKYGNAPVSAYAYSHFGLILGSGFGRYKMGYTVGKMGIRLSEKFDNINLVGLCNFAFGCFINSWKSHVAKNCDYLRVSYQHFLNSGNLIYAGYSLACLMYSKDVAGESLDKLNRETRESIIFVSKIKENDVKNFLVVTQRNILSLKGLTRELTSFSDDNFDENCLVKEIKKCSNLNPLSWYYLNKMRVFYLYGNYEESYKMASELNKVLNVSFGLGFVPEYYFYLSLTLIALYPTARLHEKIMFRCILYKNQIKMRRLANNCPDNFLHKYLLVAAEMSGTFGSEYEASRLYNLAIKSAKKNGYIQNEAIANERAAKFCMVKTKSNAAKNYLLESRSCYLKWGASAKVKDLEREYALFNLIPQDGIRNLQTSSLDFNAVLKALQTLSTEINLDKLLSRLMLLTMENAGAQKGFLIMEKDESLFIEAEYATDKDDITLLESIPVEASSNLSHSIINYVKTTREDIVLDDATREDMFNADPYIIKNKPRSILCIPIINQTKVVSILYLENNLTTNAFTPKRQEILKLILSQAAISLENARLYHEMKELNNKLRMEVLERNNAEKALVEQVRLASLGADIGVAITQNDTLMVILSSCSELLVRHLDVELVRVWTFNKHEKTLELQASAGMYTNTDGDYCRVPVGKFKIGEIAQEKKPYLTNEVIGDSSIHDQKWAGEEGISAFAGYPLIVKDQLMGVMAVFARKPLKDATRQAMSSVADAIAICIKNKHTEDEIVEREKELRFITESSLDAIFTITKAGKFLYISPSWKEFSGYEAHEVIGTYFIKYVPAKELPRYWKVLADVFLRKKIMNFETYVKHRDGHVFPVEFTGHLVKREGELVGQGTVRDITMRKKAEEEQNRLITAMESAGEAIAITDINGNIQYVNPAFVRIAGYGRKEVQGQNMRIFKSGKQDLSFYNNMWKNISKGKVWTGRIVNKKKNGKLFTEMLTISPVRNSDGKVVNYVAVKRDVTREIELETQLRQSQRFESLGTMARGIAHDFNNILSSIIGFTEITVSDLSNENEVRDNLKEVLNASHRAKGLVRQILTSSQQSIEDRKAVDIVPIVKEVLTMISATLPKTTKICYDNCKECYTIIGDHDQIYQVIANLCVNAGQAIGDRGGVLNVKLVLEEVNTTFARKIGVQKGIYVKLEVTDTGCGMDADVMDRIFDPFFTTKDVGEGSGMGLAVVNGIVASHKGVITVNSERKKGSTFNVYFPLIESGPALENIVETNLVSTGKEHILFVDDEEAIVRYSEKGLRSLGYEVTVSTNSETALELFSAQPDKFDILITDLSMPKMNGDLLARNILRIKPGMPVILCSGFNNVMNLEKATEIGISECIMKPVSSRNLAVIIRRAMKTN